MAGIVTLRIRMQLATKNHVSDQNFRLMKQGVKLIDGNLRHTYGTLGVR